MQAQPIWTATPGFDRTIETCLERLPFEGVPKVLDVPCGRGEALRRIAARHRIDGLGIDCWPEVVDSARDQTARVGLLSQLRFLAADASRLDLEDESFDICLSIGGPSCISPDPASFAAPDRDQLSSTLGELSRVVRRGGYLVVSDMFYDAITDHPPRGRNLDPLEWQADLRSAGVEVVYFEHYRADAWEEYLEPRRERLRVQRLSAADDEARLATLDEQEQGLDADEPPGAWANYGIFVGVRRP